MSEEEFRKYLDLLQNVLSAQVCMNNFLSGLEHKYGNLVRVDDKDLRICRRGNVYYLRDEAQEARD